jgi:glycosyltransferase involved in cell wall biosynthesis
MKILLVSPLGFTVPQDGYAGIESLVYNFSRELSRQHDVTVMGRADSAYPEAVRLLPTEVGQEDIFLEAEHNQYIAWQSRLRDFDVIHDFSHQHLAARFNANLPTLNIFWHAPNEQQYPKAPYNIIGLSRWACRMFERYYHQKARYQQSIALDVEKYKPGTLPRTDRFLTLGIMAPQKGNLEAARLCKEMGVPLDIAGKPVDPAYVKDLMTCVDGGMIHYHGEVTEAKKIELMQTCKGLIYYLQRPEVTSHKVQEAMLCGAPIITADIGALPEIIEDGVDGILCRTDEDYKFALRNVLPVPEETRAFNARTYAIETVVRDYVPLYQEVAGGLRW